MATGGELAGSIGRGALRTNVGHTIDVAAVVAYHLVEAAVPGEGHVAAFAARHPSAGATFEQGRIATPVLEEDGLFAACQRIADGLQQLGREGAAHAVLASEDVDVDHLNDGHLHLLPAFAEGDETVLAVEGVVVALDGRCGGAEERVGVELRGQYDGHVAGMVARRGVLLLVGVLVLLVNDHQPEPLEGQEHR